MSFEAGNGEVTIKFGNLSLAVDPSTIPQSALYNAIMSSLSKVALPDSVQTEIRDGKIILSGNAGAGDFTLTLGKNFVPETLEVPEQKLIVNFNSFKYSA